MDQSLLSLHWTSVTTYITMHHYNCTNLLLDYWWISLALMLEYVTLSVLLSMCVTSLCYISHDITLPSLCAKAQNGPLGQ